MQPLLFNLRIANGCVHLAQILVSMRSFFKGISVKPDDGSVARYLSGLITGEIRELSKCSR
jgi:hypothetical protein